MNGENRPGYRDGPGSSSSLTAAGPQQMGRVAPSKDPCKQAAYKNSIPLRSINR